jgi:hypothetical protein
LAFAVGERRVAAALAVGAEPGRVEAAVEAGADDERESALGLGVEAFEVGGERRRDGVYRHGP